MKIAAKVGTELLEVEIERVDGAYVVTVDGKRHTVDALKLESDFYSILTDDGRSYEVSVEARREAYHVRHRASERLVTLTDPGRAAREAKLGTDGDVDVVSQMPGKVVRVLVAEGDAVEAGQGLLVVEAMKMENEITAPRAGKVASLPVPAGEAVEGGVVLAVIE